MDAAVAGIIGAAVGAGASIIGQFVAGHHQQRLEQQKADRARQDELSKECRRQIAELERLIHSMFHSAQWLTWHALNDPPSVDEKMLAQYRKEVHETLPRLAGGLAVLDTLDHGAHDVLVVSVGRVIEVDGAIGIATVGFKSDPDSVRAALAGLYSWIDDLGRKWLRGDLSMR